MSGELEAIKFKLFCCMYLGCGKEYGSKFNLKRHIEIFHLRSKEVECPICSKKFRIMQNFIEHSYIHREAKPYKCNLCGDVFRHNATFLSHKRKNLCKVLKG